MKFLCPQCKAKYRIADEKLAQRNSSRMKCRKCGHVIDIHAAAVPESIRPPGAPPRDDDEDGDRPSVVSSAPPPPVAPAPKGLAPPPRRPGATAPTAPSVKRPAAPSVTASAPKRSVVAPPRRGGVGSAAVATAEKQAEKPASEPQAAPPQRKSVPPPRRTLADDRKSIVGQPKPPAAKGPAEDRKSVIGDRKSVVGDRKSALGDKKSPSFEKKAEEPSKPAGSSPLASSPETDFEDEAPTRIHDGTSLAAAFSLSLDSASVASAAGPASVPDEWYIGIDGSPVGPLAFAQLREKASSGAATPESLVWRDGFEEWKPLKEFPELIALVEEAQAAPAGFSAAPLPAPVPPPTTGTPAPAVVPAVAAASADIVFPKSEPDKSEAKPSGRREHSIIERFSLRPIRTGLSHRMAWAGVIVALAFGVTIGIVLFSKTEQKEVVKYVEVPASAKPEEASNGPQTLEEATVLADPATKKVGTSSTKVEPAPQPATTGKSGLSGLNGLNGLNGLGPTGNGPDVSQSPAPGGQLDGAAISRVVSNFTPSVRRGCWDPAILSRAPDAPSTARVSVSITIAQSGNVESVTTSGDPKGYPNLAHCIESKVRAWKFPRSGGSTTANVPFVFASQ